MKKQAKLCTVTPQAAINGGVAAYLRVSTEEQKDSHLGLDAQQVQCEAMAQVKGWAVPMIYCDAGVSGAKPLAHRPAMSQLLSDIHAQKVHALIVPSLDRLGRKAGIIINFVEELTGYQVKLVSCKESLDTSTSQGQFMLNIFASLAQMERDMTIERTKAALDARGRRDGDKGGKVPFGYKRVFELQNSEGTAVPKRVCIGIEIDEDAAKIVRRIFAMRKRGATLRAIATDVQKSHSSIAEILHNRDIYKGGRRGESDIHWPAILK